MAKRQRGGSEASSSVIDLRATVQELQAIKLLLVLLLAKLGSDSAEIAMALGIEESTVRRWISMRKVEKIVK